MAVRLHAMTCGWLTGPLGAFLEGAEGRIRVPVPCYLVVHPKGHVLFDTGLHPDTQHDPAGRLGAAARVYGVEFTPGEEVSRRLEGLDVAPDEIDLLVNSHLHFDHTGGNAQIPDARLVIQRDEWAAGSDPDLAAANFFHAHDYDLGHDVWTVDGECDLFGDRSVVCVPTPGHTPGHQSLRVELESGPVVLAADACYLRQSLEHRHLPPVVFDREAMQASLERLDLLRRAGARIFYGHDPEFWDDIPQAPGEVR